MKVIGYSKQLSVFPGENVDFLVSCDTEQYHADIVKLIHGDTNPDGPGLKIDPVQTGIDADFPGRVSNSQYLWMKIFRRLRVEGGRGVVRRVCR
jgi:hypothetical protein